MPTCIETVDRVARCCPSCKQWIPADVEISILSDRTTTIRASVQDMQSPLLVTIALVMMVVFLFLRPARRDSRGRRHRCRWRCPALGAAMWAAGFSIDNISLMALAISVGFVVDDAIVVIENIFRNLEEGMTPFDSGA
jgi:multidrug efflux pump